MPHQPFALDPLHVVLLITSISFMIGTAILAARRDLVQNQLFDLRRAVRKHRNETGSWESTEADRTLWKTADPTLVAEFEESEAWRTSLDDEEDGIGDAWRASLRDD